MNILTRLLLIASLIFSFSLVSGNAQTTVKSIRDQGVAFYKAGRYEEAKILFEEILRRNPRDPYAKSYHAKCQMAIKNNLGRNDLEGELAKIIIPQLSFSEAPIGDVLDFLATKTEQLSQGKTVVNFIYKGTSEQRENTKITLTVRNVPVTEAIRYVGQLSRTHFSFEEHAVVGDPNYVPPKESAEEKAAKAANKANPFFESPVKDAASSIFD
ncbi:MAG: hypothetical protein CMO55_19230 [Verrucomicrobiales bacterium]|nr:hypothetical protein [Verrucomicrobiales bacterium]